MKWHFPYGLNLFLFFLKSLLRTLGIRSWFANSYQSSVSHSTPMPTILNGNLFFHLSKRGLNSILVRATSNIAFWSTFTDFSGNFWTTYFSNPAYLWIYPNSFQTIWTSDLKLDHFVLSFVVRMQPFLTGVLSKEQKPLLVFLSWSSMMQLLHFVWDSSSPLSTKSVWQ